MKNMILAACLLLAPFLSYCQQSEPVIKSFYEKYSELDNVFDIKLSGGVLKMISSFSKEEGSASDPVERISYLRILIMDDGNLVEKSDFNKLMKSVRADAFENLVQIREGETKVEVMIKERQGVISNALLVVNDEDNFVLISLEGEFSLEDLESLDIDVEGAEYFKKMKKQKKAGKKRA